MITDPELAVRVRQGTLRPIALAVKVRRGTRTLILSLLFGSGGEHCDQALAVEVRQESL